MTEQALKDLIKLGLPSEVAANADKYASSLLTSAVSIVGRMDGADWNKKEVTFNLTAGTATYILGKDILSQYPTIEGLERLHFTDSENYPISVLRKDDFDVLARGVSGNARPVIATVYETIDGRVLEISRTPDSAYEMKGMAKMFVDKLSQVPENYHDLVLNTAYKLIAASKNAGVASLMVNEGQKDARSRLTEWSGSTVTIDRGLDVGNRRSTRVDSGNLRP